MLNFLNKRLNMLKILSKHADFKTRKALAEGLILSKIDYCVSLWGITINSILDRIQKVQNKAVRVVFGKRDYRAVTLNQLFKQLKWLKIKETRKYHDTISLHTMLTYQTPHSIAKKFNTHTAAYLIISYFTFLEIHDRSTTNIHQHQRAQADFKKGFGEL